MKNSIDIDKLTDVAYYILDTEFDDFKDWVLYDAVDPRHHVYAMAYVALHGEHNFETHLRSLETDKEG